MSGSDWKEIVARQAAELLAAGLIEKDDNGGAVLTEKGKKRAAARLDKLPIGDDILLEIAFCESRQIEYNPF